MLFLHDFTSHAACICCPPHRKEINRVMQDMSRQLLKHMDEVRASERESRDKEAKQIQRLKRELHSMESQLNAEKALHAITKSALQNLEEDCTRLRQQLHNIRRRGYNQDKSVSLSSRILIDLQSEIFCG